MDEEFSRVKNQGDKRLLETETRLQENLDETENAGESKLRTLDRRSSLALEMAEEKSQFERDLEHQDSERQINILRSTNENRLNDLSQSSREKLTKDRERFRDENKRAHKVYKSNYTQHLKKNMTSLAKMNQKAAQSLDELKQEYSTKLDAYSDRGEDPFYQLVDLEGVMDENDDEFVFTAQIPSHEQSGITVTVNADQLIISGRRQVTDSVTTDDGTKRTTSSFQTFTESYPLTFPVNKRGLQKLFEDDTLIVRIPKRKFDLEYKLYDAHAKGIKKIHAERPMFPNNLPVKKDPDAEPKLARPTNNTMPLDSDNFIADLDLSEDDDFFEPV